MGCGKSALDDEYEEQIFREKTKKIISLSTSELVLKLDTIKDLSSRINKETNSGSRYLFSLIDDLVKVSNYERWE